ncbi:unnamed protein product [Ranitomeya imitator]|uniref:Helix-turn-helix domain-containing protein n=1 Tax=Ranitomeya imitator TaxID=111125 RepID=A0ABN9MMK2_9NEOB|nr:unnamed protein product [Ranitomeya imitator]
MSGSSPQTLCADAAVSMTTVNNNLSRSLKNVHRSIQHIRTERSGMYAILDPRFFNFQSCYIPIRCVETLPSFIKDTTDILTRLNNIQLEQDMFLVTCDVESLYTSICHDHGITASRFFLQMTDLDDELIQFIIDLVLFTTCLLLHATSAHHPQTIGAIPVGQFLRMKRICSDNTKFQKQARILTNNLQQRGYNHRSIRKGYRRALATPRSQLLCQRNKESREQPVRLITTFNSRWTEILDILKKYWPILHADEDLCRFLPAYPSVTWRRSKNLKDLLTRSHYVAPHRSPFSDRIGPRWGSFQCGDCSACQCIERVFSFENSDATRTYTITHHISCTTDMVVYYAYCPCKLIYVGMTTRQLKVRVLEHMRDIRNAVSVHDITTLKTLPKHFKSHHGSNPKWLRVRGIDRVQAGIRGGDYKKELLKREARWIVSLNTTTPRGLNESLSFKSFFRNNIWDLEYGYQLTQCPLMCNVFKNKHVYLQLTPPLHDEVEDGAVQRPLSLPQCVAA